MCYNLYKSYSNTICSNLFHSISAGSRIKYCTIRKPVWIYSCIIGLRNSIVDISSATFLQMRLSYVVYTNFWNGFGTVSYARRYMYIHNMARYPLMTHMYIYVVVVVVARWERRLARFFIFTYSFWLFFLLLHIWFRNIYYVGFVVIIYRPRCKMGVRKILSFDTILMLKDKRFHFNIWLMLRRFLLCPGSEYMSLSFKCLNLN